MIGQALTLATNIYLKRQELPGVQISSVPLWLIAGAIGLRGFSQPDCGPVSGFTGGENSTLWTRCATSKLSR